MQASLQCLLALFLASPRPRPQQSQTQSAAALSRFLNRYGWPTGAAIQTTRKRLKRLINRYLKSHRGRLPIVYAVVDLTCLEKTGKYKGLPGLVRTDNGKRGGACRAAIFSDWPFSLSLEFSRLSRQRYRYPDATSRQALESNPPNLARTEKNSGLGGCGI